MTRVFLSYSHKDEDFVKELFRRLKRDEVDCFFDKESIAWGSNWVLELERGINESEIIVLVLSPDFCESEWIRIERTSGMIEDPAGLRRKLRPLLLRPCEVPRFLRPIHYIDISSEVKFEKNYPRICLELGGKSRENGDYLAKRIIRRFQLKEVLLVSTPPGARLYEALGQKAAEYFMNNIKAHSIVGFSCGNTIFQMANSLPQFKRPLSIYPISFNVGPSLIGVMSPYATLFEVCRRNPSAIAYDIPVPAFFSNLDLEKTAIFQRSDISRLLDRAYNPTAAFYSAGHLGPGSSYDRAFESIRNIIPDFQYSDLEKLGACGEINWFPYSIAGRPIEHKITNHCTSLGITKIKELAKDPRRDFVLVAGGPDKIRPILGALRGRFLNVLITDVNTAKAIMDEDDVSN